MISEHSRNVTDRAKTIYNEKLRTQREAEHSNRFVAIEPESEEYFVADSFSNAVKAARKAHPDQISFVIRIGHEAALHIGASRMNGHVDESLRALSEVRVGNTPAEQSTSIVRLLRRLVR